MALFDSHANFASGKVTVAPSPQSSGTTLSMSNADAANFPDPQATGNQAYNMVVWASNQNPLSTNSEVVRITAKGAADSGGTGFTQFTIIRLQEQNSPATMTARTIQVGDWCSANITKKWFVDLENALTGKTVITVGKSAGADFITTNYASDDLALQAALNSITTGFNGGAAIKVAKGTYDFVSGVVVPSTVHNLLIFGEGLSTIIRWKNGNTFSTAIANSNWLITTTTYCVITDMQLQGNSTFACPINGVNTFTPQGSNTLGGGIQITAARAWLDRIYVSGFAEDGITNKGGIGTKYGEVEVIGCGGIGLNITNTLGGGGNYATDGDLSSIWVGSCGMGIYCAEGGTWIAGAHVWGCQTDGLKIDADLVRVIGGYYETNGQWGINVNGRTRNIIIGNDIWGNGYTYTNTTSYGGVNASGASYGNIISNNQLRDNRYNSVLLTGSSTENVVSNNKVSDSFGRNQTTGAAISYTASATLTTNTTFSDSNNPSWIQSPTCIGMTLVITGAGVSGATLTTQIVAWSNPSTNVYNVTLQTAMSTAVTNPTYSVHAVAYGVREQSTAANNSIFGNIVNKLDVQLGQIVLNSVSNSNSSSFNNIGVDSKGWVEAGTVSSGSLSPDARNGGIYHATLGADVTSINFFPTTPINRNTELTLFLTQDATGGRAVSGWNSNIKLAGGSYTPSPSGTDVLAFRHDGTNWQEIYRSVNNVTTLSINASGLVTDTNSIKFTGARGEVGYDGSLTNVFLKSSTGKGLSLIVNGTTAALTIDNTGVVTVPSAGNHTFFNNKGVILTSNSATNAYSPVLEFHNTTAYDRAWPTWIDQNSRQQTRLGWHDVDYASGQTHHRFEIKTSDDPATSSGSTPNMITRFYIESDKGDVNIGINTGFLSLDSYNDGVNARTTQQIAAQRQSVASSAGASLKIIAGGATSGGTNLSGGDLILSSGISTGSSRSGIQFLIAHQSTTGTADNSPTQSAYLAASGVGSNNVVLSLHNTASLTGIPFSNSFIVSGQNVGGVGAYRNTTANTAGNNMTVQASGATSGATDKAGGSLILQSGISTGTGNSQVLIQTQTPAGSTATTDNSYATRATFDSTGLTVVGKVSTDTLRVGTSTTAGYVLTADALGNATWQAATGGGGGGVAWGAITGTLSSQTDLQTALNAKASTSSLATVATSGSHLDLSNIGTNTHAQIDTALTRLANTSGTNTGDQDLSGYVPTTRTVNGHALSANVSVTASDVGLGSVENTALSTWAGSADITTLGTIATGVWNGTAIGRAYVTGLLQSDISGLTTASSPTFAGLSLGTGALNTVGDITIEAASAHIIGVSRNTVGAGNITTIQGQQAQSGGTNLSGGNLQLYSGLSTGSSRSTVIIGVSAQGTSGTGDNAISQVINIFQAGSSIASAYVNLGAGGSATGAGATGNSFNVSGQNPGAFGAYRHTVANTAGNNLVIVSAGATSGATDKAAGQLILKTGLSTGTGGGDIVMQTPTPQGSTNTTDNTPATRLTVNSSGAAFTVPVTTTSTGIGYATGAGGTVTQATSKATGVTLSKATGQITMNAAALAAATIVSFVLTNTVIAATDILLINHISGGTPGSYSINAQAAAGSATINVRNNTAGSLSEAIVLAFAIIKGVTS